jgi:hypothetical protein
MHGWNHHIHTDTAAEDKTTGTGTKEKEREREMGKSEVEIRRHRRADVVAAELGPFELQTCKNNHHPQSSI